MEYATKNSVSLSTLRRYIKAGKVEYRLEEGRYLIWDTAEAPSPLVSELRDAQEEIAELKMLVAIYEEQLALQSHEKTN
jgi:hypothetical protein